MKYRFWVVFEYRNEIPVRRYEVGVPVLSQTGGYYAAVVMGKLGNPKKWFDQFYSKGKLCPRRFSTTLWENWEEEQESKVSMIKSLGLVDPWDTCPAISYYDLESFLKAIKYKGKRQPWHTLPALPDPIRSRDED